MSPPVFNPLVCLLAGRRRNPVVMDAHSGTFNDPRWAWSHLLCRWCARRCVAVVVTNRDVARPVLDMGNVVVLHDPLEVHPAQAAVPSTESTVPYVVFPASSAPDEPMEAVAVAARRLRGQVTVLVTGRRATSSTATEPTFTGHLPDDGYHRLLSGAGAVLALTTREGTMQRAAYEALEVGTPIVCSDTRVLRQVFGDVADYCDNTGDSLAAAIDRALRRPREQNAAAQRRLLRALNRQGDDVLSWLRDAVPTRSAPLAEARRVPA